MEPETKTPSETRTITVDFSPYISSSVSISSATASSVNGATFASSSSSIFNSTTGSVSGYLVTWATLSGQVDGEEHLITYSATGSDGKVYQAYHTLTIRAPRS